ncbi:hypothetical protein C5612_13195 [Pseudomonas frederiksbergensis]|uniref:EF-hand domain-containing protein n=1 Tax=Pseudomonas frederiksbergensis TaxID=104087 RepID=A0A2S8HLX4_9PSED|nr:EF-hand domain-containing protein [Pseudomonas frederiksbergensis]PQP03494.1 hypothetical protein C5612_13195 [Pseudomonas frederiksbergensis]
MSTGLLEQRANYPHTQYEYGPAKGYADADGDGRKEIDCSGLLYRMLKDAGYSIPYLTTGQLNVDVTHFDVVPLANVEPGDIALWINFHGHTGVVETINSVRNAGDFFGSQSSSGPKSAKYGHGSGYWPMPEKFLRPKPQYRTGAQPAPAAAPAPAPAPVAAPTGPAPLMNFQYPFRKADGKQFTDAEELYKVLEGETSGHYLLGSNKFWHGGIHITDKSAPQCVLNEPVRCMADGEVVAYRLNQDYLESTFGDNEKKLKYSNSFCLVRHEYKSAPNPEEGPNKGKQNKLIFYSLYMHLLPYKRYPLSPDETPKPKVTMKVGDFKAYDEAPLSSDIISPGKVTNGTKLEVLEQKDVNNITYAKGKILSGSVKAGSNKVRDVGTEIWFAYLKDGEPYKNSQHHRIWTADAIPERARPNYWQGKVKARATKRLPIHQSPANPTNGQPAGAPVDGGLELAVNSVIEFDSKEIVNLVIGNKLRRMASCTLVSGGVWQPTGNAPPTFWTNVENDPASQYVQWETVTPTDFDSVASTRTGIKAGDPIGYLGQIENLTDENGGVASKYQVHVEIFTAEADVKEFLKNSAGLKIGKQYLYLPVGAELKKKAPATGTTPLKKEHAVDLRKAPVIKEGSDDYYEVKVTEDGQSITGLVKKAGAEVITQHDWEKMGFQIVEETNATADGFLDPEDMPQFFKDLFAKVDKNHDGEVDPGELADALKNADTRDQWAKFIAHHPTEWKSKADAPKWSKLDKLLELSPKTLKHEKERISKYVFWEELSGSAVINSEVVWHFHPVEFVRTHLLKRAPSGWAHSAFANLLGKVESNNDYTAYNATTPVLKSFYNTNLTSLTIAEVQQKQENDEMFATGRYQLITPTLAEAVDKLGLDTSQKYDEAMQDRIFVDYLIKIKRKAIINYLEGDGDVEDAIYAWAKEFASAGVRQGKKISSIVLKDAAGVPILHPVTHKKQWVERHAQSEGVSFYQGDGLNSAHITPDEMVRALEESKRNAG